MAIVVVLIVCLAILGAILLMALSVGLAFIGFVGRLLGFLLRLCFAAAAGVAAALTSAGIFPDAQWTAIPAALITGVVVFGALDRRSREVRHAPDRSSDLSRRREQVEADARPHTPEHDRRPSRGWRRTALGAKPDPAPLLDPSLKSRLKKTEARLSKAARDEVGHAAAEWLTFFRRRVPDLIAAARDVYEDADDTEKTGIALQLATHLEEIIVEAEARLDRVLSERRDLFTTRAAHARERIRNG